MTDKQTLLALAERCEAATEGDRELDAEIACYIGKPLGNIDHWLHGADISYRPTAYGYYVAVIPVEGGETRTSEAFKATEFTASLDVAMTLADGWFRITPHGDRWDALGKTGPWCTAATPALALCAAALRARAGDGG